MEKRIEIKVRNGNTSLSIRSFWCCNRPPKKRGKPRGLRHSEWAGLGTRRNSVLTAVKLAFLFCTCDCSFLPFLCASRASQLPSEGFLALPAHRGRTPPSTQRPRSWLPRAISPSAPREAQPQAALGGTPEHGF